MRYLLSGAVSRYQFLAPSGTQENRISRSADKIAKLTADVLAYVKANPGVRIGDLAKGLRKESKDLRRSIPDLLAAKKLRTKRQKRATVYYAVGAVVRPPRRRQPANRRPEGCQQVLKSRPPVRR